MSEYAYPRPDGAVRHLMPSRHVLAEPQRGSCADRIQGRDGARFLALLAAATGVSAAYLFATLGRFSLWLDEAWVAESVLRGGAITSDTLQSTPLGFYLILQAVTGVLGPSEFGFRFVPVMFFAAATAATGIFARQLLGRDLDALMAATLVCTSFPAIVYAQNVKPYTADMFFAALIPVLALRVSARGSLARWLSYGLTMAVAPLFSFTALAVAASTAAFLLVADLQRPKNARQVRAWLMTHVAAGLLVIVYALTLLRSQRSDGLLEYWASGFPPDGVTRLLPWFATRLWELVSWFFTPLHMWINADRIVQGVAIALILLGIAKFVRSRATYIVLLLGPIVVILAAAVVHLYPFAPMLGGRLLLCLLPAVCVLIASGLNNTRTRLRTAGLPSWAARSYFVAATALVGSSGIAAVLTNTELGSVPREDLRQLVVSQLLPELRAGDAVYLYYGAVEAFEYYAPGFRADSDPEWGRYTMARRNGVELVYGGEHRAAHDKYAAELDSTLNSLPPGRTWIVLSHVWPGEEEALTNDVVARGLVKQVWRQPGAALYLVNTASS